MFLKEIKETIEQVLSVDILQPNKKREVIEARALFSLISMIDKKRKLRVVGALVNKDHSTVVHYLKLSVNLITYDKVFRDKYILCLRALNKSEAEINRLIKPEIIHKKISKRKAAA